MKCFRCNREIDDDSVFCPMCGAKLSMSKPQAEPKQVLAGNQKPEYAYTEHASRMAGKNQNSRNEMNDQNKGGNRRLTIVCIVLAVAAVSIGVITAMITAKKKVSYPDDQRMTSIPENTEENKAETTVENASGSSADSDIAAASESTSNASLDVTDVKAVLLQSKPEFDETMYQKVTVKKADASSTINQDDFDNDAMVMFDGLDETSWQEGVKGYGVGEYAQGYFDGSYDVKYICFKLGNWRTEDMFVSNAIPGELLITMGEFSDSVKFSKMENKPFEQWIELTDPVSADSLKVTIEDVWPGKEYDDTCIAEIIIYGQKK